MPIITQGVIKVQTDTSIAYATRKNTKKNCLAL